MAPSYFVVAMENRSGFRRLNKKLREQIRALIHRHHLKFQNFLVEEGASQSRQVLRFAAELRLREGR
jgi:hypothetical protein